MYNLNLLSKSIVISEDCKQIGEDYCVLLFAFP